MMFCNKLWVAAAILSAAVSLYAQKPVAAAVTDIEDDPANGLEMCRSLFNEYYLSELTTHAKVNMLDTATIQNSITKLKLSRGQKLSEKQIQQLCQSLKTDALCLVKMARGKDKAIVITVDIADKDGKKAGTVTASMKGISDTDSVSSNLAKESARILRKLRGIKDFETKNGNAPSLVIPKEPTEK